MTGSEQAGQRRLPFGTADSPQGADAGAEADRSAAATVAVILIRRMTPSLLRTAPDDVAG